jgi:hypothetical protein
MEPSSGSAYNKYDKLIEISIWIHIVVQRVPIITVVKIVENCALCYDEHYNIKNIRNVRVHKDLCLKY